MQLELLLNPTDCKNFEVLAIEALKLISLFMSEEHFPVVLIESLVGVLLIMTSVKNVTSVTTVATSDMLVVLGLL